MGVNKYYLELMIILLNIFQPQKLMKKTYVGRDLIFEEQRQEALENKLGWKFIRINLSKEGYDADYEASRIQRFISKFKDRQLKKSNKKIKELEDKIKKFKTSINKSKRLKQIVKKYYLPYKNGW